VVGNGIVAMYGQMRDAEEAFHLLDPDGYLIDPNFMPGISKSHHPTLEADGG
jgi:hypothetical protein